MAISFGLFNVFSKIVLSPKKTTLFHSAFNDRSCIFIHIPKTAGSSVSMGLFGFQVSHRAAIEYRNEDVDKFDEYFKFSFVRNPWSRLVSAYFYLQQGGMSYLDSNWYQENISKYSTFDLFVKNWLTEDNVQTKSHFIPQYQFINGGSLSSRTILVDFVGKVENLTEDIAHVSDRIGVPINLAPVNVSTHDNYRDYYNEETREIVRKVYSIDIEIFGYDF